MTLQPLFLKFLKRTFMTVGVIGALTACATTDQAGATFVKSENFNSRVKVVVLHYTVSDFDSSLHVLTKPTKYPVSSHYLVPTPDDDSYNSRKLKTYQLVKETDRAWHAGRSYWNKRTSLNDMSIGIEIVNEAHCERPKDTPAVPGQDISTDQICTFPDYPEEQVELLLGLMAGIKERNPDVHPTDYIGHSDIAPDRKLDPGPKFPWKRLAEAGFGAWYDDDTVAKYADRFRVRPLPITNIQKALHTYGYKIEQTGVMDEQTRNVIKAFQMHFHQSDYSGKPTVETVAKLYALIEKYRSDHLEALLKPITSTQYMPPVSP